MEGDAVHLRLVSLDIMAGFIRPFLSAIPANKKKYKIDRCQNVFGGPRYLIEFRQLYIMSLMSSPTEAKIESCFICHATS